MPTIRKKSSSAKKTSEPEIINAAHKVSAFASKNGKQLSIAAAALLVLLVIVSGYLIVRSGNDKKASALLSAAYQYYSPSAGTQPDFQKALELYRDIGKKYSGTMSAAVAQYYAGNCLAGLGRFNDAVKEYQQFMNKYSGEKELAGLAYQRMGFAYNALGSRDDAAKAFEKSEAMLGPGAATAELARLYELAGKPDEAAKKNMVIKEKLQGTSWDRELKAKDQKDAAALPVQVKGSK